MLKKVLKLNYVLMVVLNTYSIGLMFLNMGHMDLSNFTCCASVFPKKQNYNSIFNNWFQNTEAQDFIRN